MADRYLGMLGLAEALGVSRHAVHKWRARHPAGSEHAFPEPDIDLDGAPGWRPWRLSEISAWRASLPGRGVGGGRPTLARQEYLQEAYHRGFDREEALRALAVFAADFPEMSEPELCAWIVSKWR
ncbi:hypothetical protein ACIBG7_02000 [Nonomuraea sp. NPDC050328]|uniref:hypothetical protein n=1 Tax=Nonomuraea sp. NPDC050328 TaxID=3364361 RepID=UPI0037B23F32